MRVLQRVVCAVLLLMLSSSANAIATNLRPSWPITYQQNRSTFAYVCNYSGYTNVSKGMITSRFGLVAFDWSNAKTDWANQQPMDCEERLVVQAAMLKASNPQTRVIVYRNLVKALPWFATVRSLLENPQFVSYFMSFNLNSSPHVPQCDRNFAPPRCSNLYHDQGQTPQVLKLTFQIPSSLPLYQRNSDHHILRRSI